MVIIEKVSITIMCTKANDQLMLSLLNRKIQHCNIIDNGSAVLIKYEIDKDEDDGHAKRVLWYAPKNLLVPYFPYPPSSPPSIVVPTSEPLTSSTTSPSSSSTSSLSLSLASDDIKDKGAEIPKGVEVIIPNTLASQEDGSSSPKITEMSMIECQQWIGQIGWTCGYEPLFTILNHQLVRTSSSLVAAHVELKRMFDDETAL
jgi:hypothetical protein